ncbi:MAG TPA: hypothetical protein PK916_08880 [Bacteroidota bacterium]|nr:hypothetical protein [Bacteroidota bacterium]
MTEHELKILNALEAMKTSPDTFRVTEDMLRGDLGEVVTRVREQWLRVLDVFEGLREQRGNRGYWQDRFNRGVKTALGSAYCHAFIEWTVAYTAELVGIPDWIKANTASSQNFFAHAQKNGLITLSILVGAVAIWRNGMTWQGHVGAVRVIEYMKETPSGFFSTEANTSNPISKWREGEWILRKRHTLGRVGAALKEGRWLRGFFDTDKAIENVLQSMAAGL